MPLRLADLTQDPFEDNIVFEPRDAEPAVDGLNDAAFQHLLAQFARLEAEERPRRRPLHLKAQLVISLEPGYGKSHLVGRLFRALADRATCVYLRPFQDAGSAWRTILRSVAQALAAPVAGGSATGLDQLAAAVFVRGLLALDARGAFNDHDGYWLGRLRTDALGTLGFGRQDGEGAGGLAEWLRGELAEGPLLSKLERGLSAGPALYAPARRWLLALAGYAAAPVDGSERAVWLEWIAGEGMGDAENGFPRPAEPPASRNEEAWRRLQDLFVLAGDYRPFLLCFDQTELLTSDPLLAARFGEVVECLVSHGLNQMAAVTTNQTPWSERILPHIQTALHARFSAPLQLRGLHAGQAGALARQRLARAGLDGAEADRFVKPAWLGELFSDIAEESVRRFLDRCSVRYRTLRDLPPPPPARLEDWFARSVAEVGKQPDGLAFDPEVLRWSLGPEALGATLPGVTAEFLENEQGALRVSWSWPSHRLYFGFESSSESPRWQSVPERAHEISRHQAKAGVSARCLYLRTPELPAIPRPTWAAIGAKMQEARDAGLLELRVIDTAQLTAILAAERLWREVAQGDAPFEREKALGFVRGKLRAWWESLRGGAQDSRRATWRVG